jgi:hypothetical protein
MDQIHLGPLVDQIQLALGHISNSLPLALESTMQVYSSSFGFQPLKCVTLLVHVHIDLTRVHYSINS